MSTAYYRGSGIDADDQGQSLGEKILQLPGGLILLVVALAGVGVAMLYSAANGSMEPWASRHIARFAVGFAIMIGVALVDLRIWLRIAYPFYFITFGLLIAVEVIGQVGMGAQRWINLGFFNLQPSELMKIALVLALARYFHVPTLDDVYRVRTLILPIILIVAPVALVMSQPDLGTAVMLLFVGAAIFFVVGVRWWKFALVLALGLAAVPIAWQFLRDYQKARVLTFINPESDPLGTGYHILQSKIALGSGGLFGKGFLQGTQSHLNFLPEMQTDFIFTMLAEEFGLIGGVGLILLFLLLVAYGVVIALRCRNHFGRILALGLTANLYFYVFINTAMVMGLIPVVGVPLPLVSYGGTVMMTIMFSLGLIMSVYIHRDTRISRRAPSAQL
ncbi:rod shape-determining protein RodA [Fodinicurvata sp. EGI_FJ10296]|uniref:rod shape-determining protein RodA n=1 Tax=Fodinicurvata sp. EGI_FJ10296 TaxID=3231908 RepID=UPI0034522550